jgi:hypothetical protein
MFGAFTAWTRCANLAGLEAPPTIVFEHLAEPAPYGTTSQHTQETEHGQG